jgi:deoxyribodipyrimidine photo-lyase
MKLNKENKENKEKQTVTLFWFRRDLRLTDQRGLAEALKSAHPVVPVFIFDPHILEKLEDADDARVNFIWECLSELHENLKEFQSSLEVLYCSPYEGFQQLIRKYDVKSVFANHDYEPFAIKRDGEIKKLLLDHQIPFLTFKDQVIFEKDEVVKADGLPYTVFTPFSRTWLKKIQAADTKEVKVGDHFLKMEPLPMLSLQDLGFKKSSLQMPSKTVKSQVIKDYAQARNFPAQISTTRLGVHLRFGTVSVRKCVQVAEKLSSVWLSELIWREFFMQILWHYPKVVTESFKPAYDKIQWRNDEKEFRAWCEGRTGYPLVDAGMRELNETGFMHNRVRMVTASFLTKHLLIDWRWGEKYFARKLLDFELSANNGNWQWAAGSGCDAAPYFRVFNPSIQQKKFDPQSEYVKRWVPEFASAKYCSPIVDHDAARMRAIKTYKEGIAK